jgi:hypothetical protein
MLVSDGGGGLFLSPIPVPPGDPAALARGAATYTAAQGEIERNRATLVSAAGQAGGPAWTGTGASGFAEATNGLAAAYAVTSAALARGATALHGYASSLATAKETARQANAAVAVANAAASALLAAQDAASQAETAAGQADQAATTAETQAAANPHSPAAQATADSARSAATDAQSSAAGAWARVATLTTQYDADRARALGLCATAQQEASQAAARAAAGFDAAASELTGKSPGPVSGGAHGVTGGSVWDMVIDEIFAWNNKTVVQSALNGWGAFGAVILGRAEVGYLESAAATGRALGTWGSTFDAIQSGRTGWFSSTYYQDWADVMGATRTQQSAWAKFLEAFRPNPGDYGLAANFARAGLGVSMLGDVLTEWRPGPSFGPGGMFGGNASRVVAGVNFAAAGIALGGSLGYAWAGAALAVIPGGQVVVAGVLIGTTLYFAGSFVYQHWNDVTSWGKDAWHGIEDAGSWAGDELGKLGGGIGHDIGKALSWL